MTPSDADSPYRVVWHPAAEVERDESWPVAERTAIQNAIEKLKAAGPTLRHPHSSAVQGRPVEGLRELRPRAGRSRWRPLYRQVNASTFVILAVAPEAQISKRGFAAAVRRAEARLSDIDVDE